MKTIDAYLLGQFIQVYCICSVSIFGLYVVADAFPNLDSFIEAGKEQGNLGSLIVTYYAYKSLAFFDTTSGILALVAAMFTMTWIQKHNELTALMAAGVSRARVAMPVICAAALVAWLAAGSRELLIPNFRKEIGQSAKDLLGTQAQTFEPRYDNDTGILFRGKRTFANEQRIDGPNLLLPVELDRYGRQLVAEVAYYQSANSMHPGGWLIEGVTHPKEFSTKPSLLGADGNKVIHTAVDRPEWLKPNQCFVVSKINFEQITGGSTWKQFSSLSQLVSGLKNSSLGFGADVRVQIHSRIVRPLLDITLLFLGLPLVIARDNRNIFLAVGLCLVVVCGFMLTVYAAQYLGNAIYVSPPLAAWLPLMIFVPGAVAMSEPLRS